MTAAERRAYERVKRMAANARPDMRRRVLLAYDVMRKAFNEREWAEAISNGTVESLLEMYMSNVVDPAFQSVKTMLDRQTIDAAEVFSRDLPIRGRIGTSFNALNPNVVSAVNTMSTAVVRGLREDVRATVLQAVQRGITEGKHPVTVARGLRQDLVLSPYQENIIANFRRALEGGPRVAVAKDALDYKLRDKRFDRTLARARASGEKLSSTQVNKMVDAYRKRLVAHNADTIARTTALDAQRVGQRQSWQDAIDQGMADVDRLYRRWVSVGDSRVRPEHVEMNGEEAKYDEAYSNGEMVPGESTYNCRCIEIFKIKRPSEVA